MLTVQNYREEIVNSVLNNRVTIVTAETGSGKSTQIPQYLTKYFKQIIVTEPRRMAAKTLAIRVSEEMGTKLGEEVGYRTAYDRCASPESKIVYCTDGLQLVRSLLGSDDTRSTLLVIDEIHEWNNNQEQLIAWTKLKNVSTLIMSATMDVKSLMEYYKDSVNAIYVPGSQFHVEMEERGSSEFINAIKENISEGKNILVFLPGKKEIFMTIDELNGENAIVLPLHGEMDWEEQSKCFAQYDLPKVICATNVAQTSITIPDIDVVVDLGLARISDVRDGIQGLFLRNISQADIKQRAGRAGRTKDGKYILCSDKPISQREEYQKPEIERSLLERVVLQFANIGLDAEVVEFFHQPPKEEIVRAKKELINLGAMDDKNNVTAIGKEMAKLPLNAQSARMIVEAEKLGVTEDVIKIASIVEIGGLLLKNQRYFCYTSESRSDLLAELDVWDKVNSQEEFDFEKGGINKKNFFKIKEHIQLVMKAIDGIVTLNSSGSREDVLKACLSGLATHIYSRHWNCFVDNNWDERKLDRKSCVEMFSSDFLIGIPKTIEFKNRFGYLSKMDLITFATAVDGDTALEIVPKSYISKEIVEEYSENEDAVVKRVITKVLDKAVKEERIVDYDNPRYDSLKRQYEEMKKWRESWMGREAFEQSYNSNKLSRQEEVRVNGKLYSVNYESGEPYITIYNSGELFEINDENITLHDGTVVTVKCAGKSSKSVSSLKKMVKEYVSVIVRKKNRDRLNAKVVNSIQNIDSVKGELGKLTFNGIIFGYSGINVEGYGCLKVRKDGQIVLDIVSDEEMAKAQTNEALKNLAMKKLKKDYVDSKFSHQTGKKKKVLTSKEETVREDFWHLATDVIASINVENVGESLQFIQDYYVELMG